jgi:hypothetical protein
MRLEKLTFVCSARSEQPVEQSKVKWHVGQCIDMLSTAELAIAVCAGSKGRRPELKSTSAATKEHALRRMTCSIKIDYLPVSPAGQAPHLPPTGAKRYT